MEKSQESGIELAWLFREWSESTVDVKSAIHKLTNLGKHRYKIVAVRTYGTQKVIRFGCVCGMQFEEHSAIMRLLVTGKISRHDKGYVTLTQETIRY